MLTYMAGTPYMHAKKKMNIENAEAVDENYWMSLHGRT